MGTDGDRSIGHQEAWTDEDLVHAWWVRSGSVLAGEYPGHPDPALARAKIDALVDAGVRTFVDLTTPDDGLEPYRHLLDQLVSERGAALVHERFPIPDLGVVEDDRYDEVVATIEEARSHGAVYVHCWGGVGRTGTVVGCLLVDEGLGYDEVIERLAALRAATRKANRPAPEVDAQRDVIRRRAARRA